MSGERQKVIIHVGPMKTGATFLQFLMLANRQRLSDAGVLIPGEKRVDQIRAVRDITGKITQDPVVRQRCSGKWAELVSEVHGHHGCASLISMEFLAEADPAAAKEIVRSLSAKNTEVHVIVTVRDAARVIPSQWQETSRYQGKLAWPAYLRQVTTIGHPHAKLPLQARKFVRKQDLFHILDTWSTAVPVGHLHVVTVPSSRHDPMRLWQRFAEAASIDPGPCQTLPDWMRPSLGQASAHLMVRMNRKLCPMPMSRYDPTMKTQLGEKILARRADREQRVRLNRTGLAFALFWNSRARWAIQALSPDLKGTLADLPTDVPDREWSQVPESGAKPTAEEVLEAAATAHVGLRELITARAERLSNVQGSGVPQNDPPPRIPPEDRWAAHERPVDAAAEDLANLAKSAIDLHQALIDQAP